MMYNSTVTCNCTYSVDCKHAQRSEMTEIAITPGTQVWVRFEHPTSKIAAQCYTHGAVTNATC